MVSQTPINSSKIDFTVRTPKVIKARNTRPKLEDVLEETTLENNVIVTTQSAYPDKVKPTDTKSPMGLGSEKTSIHLKLHKEELERGVFMNSTKSPILTLGHHTQGLNPMPFSHYRKTGILAQETMDVNGKVT